ncbi:hypothetical protein B0T21DRAFT_345848 [Apiosordaria backusii]|uniref:Uncharacterized protein n=1 Tax=Apiosordaria backusii TaxID=314023 RepID=A0AA40EME6_9PEZI|nr:hypothetical protein B0T21DRAFT_345848 [Apiosordaria backusii]
MMRTALARRAALRSTRQFHSTPFRQEFIKKDSPDGTTSMLAGSPKTYALLGAAIIGVGGTYGMMMGSPRSVVPDDTAKQSVSGTSPTARANQPIGKTLQENQRPIRSFHAEVVVGNMCTSELILMREDKSRRM